MKRTITEKNKEVLIKWILPCIHLLISVLLNRNYFDFTTEIYFDGLVPLNNSISDKMELLVAFFVTSAFLCVIIFLIWNLVWKIMDKSIKAKTFILFTVIYLIGGLLILFLYPDSFEAEWDNLTTLYCSKRFIPFYWHHIFTSCLFSACQMLFPHPISIQLLQWLAFTCTIAYLYISFEKNFKEKWLKYLVLGFFLIPDSYYIMSNPYRNCMYTILCMFAFSYVCFSAIEHKTYNKMNVIKFLFLSLLIIEWRSEGFFLGLLAYSTYLFLVVRKKRIIIKYSILLIVGIYFFSLPQKIGEVKYFGSDYLIASTINQLKPILNDEQANFSYIGAEEDLEIINKICPVEIIKQWGLTGYRCFNYQQGRYLNQSHLSKEDSSKYKVACMRIFANNPIVFIKNQCNFFLYCMGVKELFFNLNEYTGAGTNIPMFEITSWDLGREDISDGFFTKQWRTNTLRQNVVESFTKQFGRYYQYWKDTKIYIFSYVGLFFGLIIISVRELLYLGKKKYNIIMGGIPLALIVTFIIIFLTMPEGRIAYFYPFYFCSLMANIIYIGFTIEKDIS